MLHGLIRAYLDEKDVVQLEADNVGAFWRWADSLVNEVSAEHEFVTHQLKTRKDDVNLSLISRPIDEASNAMARYLARYGAENFDMTIIITHPFGRIREFWSMDMGLGPVGDQFVPEFLEEWEDGAMNVDHVVKVMRQLGMISLRRIFII